MTKTLNYCYKIGFLLIVLMLWGSVSVQALTAITNSNIQTAVNLWVSDQSGAEATYGHISSWDTSAVTSMYQLFYNKRTFNDDISNWDVSNVTNMFRMFRKANQFNQDIGNWDTSQVINMKGMFEEATQFNQDINTKEVTVDGNTYIAWDVSKVTNMSGMLNNADAFNHDIGNWDTSNVTNMMYLMFANLFDQPINTKEVTVGGNTYIAWDVSKVINMSGLFGWGAIFNQDIGNWDTSSVTNMSYMFYKNEVYNQNMPEKQVTVGGNTYTAWDTSSVTNMKNMFYVAEGFDGDVNNWDVSNVTNMKEMFLNAYIFNQDIRSWAVSSGADLTNMLKSTTAFQASFYPASPGYDGSQNTPTYDFFNYIPSLFSSIPSTISYQGKLTETSLTPINSDISMIFTLYDGGGASVWTETHPAVTIVNGHFNVDLGSITPIPSTVYGNDSLELGIQVGSEDELTPRTTLSSVGYTFVAKAIGDKIVLNTSDQVEISGHLLPAAQDTYDLGAPDNRWRDIYVSTGSVHIGDEENGVVLSYEKEAVADEAPTFKIRRRKNKNLAVALNMASGEEESNNFGKGNIRKFKKYLRGRGKGGTLGLWWQNTALSHEKAGKRTRRMTYDMDLFWDDANDRLGVKTDSPSESLDVDGDILFDGTLIQVGKTKPSSFSKGITTFDIFVDGGKVGIGDGATEKAYMDSTGSGSFRNVAIASGKSLLSRNLEDTIVSDWQPRLITPVTDSGVDYLDLYVAGNPVGTGADRVQAAPMMRLTEAGNVGIGTLTPSKTLDVEGIIKATSFIGNGANLTGLISTGHTHSFAGSSHSHDYSDASHGHGTGAGPSGLSGLVIWLDASDLDGDGDTTDNPSNGSAVTSWTDKSGNGNHASSIGTPVYSTGVLNSKGVIEFVGNVDGMTLGEESFDSDYTIFIIERYSGSTKGRILQSRESGRNWLLGRWGGNHRMFNDGWVYSGGSIGEIWTLDMGMRSGNTTSFYADGELKGSRGGGNYPSRLGLAKGGIHNGEWSHSQIAEIIAFNRAITDSERADINAYLAHKWGLTVDSDGDGTVDASDSYSEGYADTSHTHSKAALAHNHDSTVSASSHAHSFAGVSHAHDSDFSLPSHGHGSTYSSTSHNHNSTYASPTHTSSHDSIYAAKNGHNHDSDFSGLSHGHGGYADSSHAHDSDFSSSIHTSSHDSSYAAKNGHNHDLDFSALSHDSSHTIYALSTHTHNKAESSHSHSYAGSSHLHDSDFQYANHSHGYAAASHSHSNVSLSNHTHTYSATNHSHSYAASSHDNIHSYAASGHGHTYNYNLSNTWFRDQGDNANVKFYGNQKQMVFRTDGETKFNSEVVDAPFLYLYGNNNAADKQMMRLHSDGTLWTKAYGLLHDFFASKAGGASNFYSNTLSVNGTLTVNGNWTRIYNNQKLRLGGQEIGWYMDNSTQIKALGGNFKGGGTVRSDTSMTAPKLVDSHDNSFYMDMDGSSMVKKLFIKERLQMGSGVTTWSDDGLDSGANIGMPTNDVAIFAGANFTADIADEGSSGAVELTFTNCGASGHYGPTSGCTDGNGNSVPVSSGIQEWTVPSSGTYTIEAWGAQGGIAGDYNGGQGAYIKGDFTLNEGEIIKILVGQQGIAAAGQGNFVRKGGAGGGGGTFVVRTPFNNTSSILVIAGGGGGPSSSTKGQFHGEPGLTGTSGGNSNIPGGSSSGCGGPATGGSNGYGGEEGCGAGGGGFLGDGDPGGHQAFGGEAFINGGEGGNSTNGQGKPYGGFGGGGAGSPSWGYGGGGGGFSGGGGGPWINSVSGNGGGGGSYNNGSSQTNTSGVRSGHGQVTITGGGPVTTTYTGVSDFRLYITDNNSDRFSIWGNSCGGGDCGALNKTNEAFRFNMDGKAYARLNWNSNTSYGHSDKRLKINITNLDSKVILDKLIQLQGVSFKWELKELSETLNFGFIAQDVEAVFPDLVQMSPMTDKRVLPYDAFTALLVEAIKARQAIIEAQRAELEQLNLDFEALEERLDRLESSK